MSLPYKLVAAAIVPTVLAACSSDSVQPATPGSDSDGSSIEARRLETLDSHQLFLDALRAGLIAQSGYYGNPVALDVENIPLPTDSPVAPSASESGSDQSTHISDSAGNDVTSTNIQEKGVDEQDWVKNSTDGLHLYVLNSAYAQLNPLGGPEGMQEETALIDIPDVDPVQTSSFAPQTFQTSLRILQLDADTPDVYSLKDLQIPLSGRQTQGFYLYENGNSRTAYLSSSGANYWANWSNSTAFAGQDSVISRVDVTDPATASITGTFRIDGQIVSSRRIGKHLFFASRFFPNLPGEQPWTQSPEQWQQTVNNAELTHLLPRYSNDGSDNTALLIDPANCFVSKTNNAHYSPDIITLGVVDLETLQLTDSECYLGASETLYASPESVFLATTQYDYATGPISENGEVIDVDNGVFPADIIWSDPRVSTDIHQFDIDNGQLVYAGSGSVRGHLGWNALRKPFRMSEKDGYLRVATFNDRQGVDQSPILMTVLRTTNAGNLDTVSVLPNENRPAAIGKPGEQLYASRFLDDRAYLVTFRQTDPLYIIDLSNPADPRVAGELEIEGYSDYLQPVGQDYLLGIGRDAVAAPGNVGNGRGALVQGIKLSLFDVSNPAVPTEVQSIRVGQRGTESQALTDHRAITIQAATDTHPMRVSFGIEVNGEASPGAPAPGTASVYYPWSYTGLHGFEIQTGANAGIVSQGALVVARGETPDDHYYRRIENDRVVMVNDATFYIRGASVYAASWHDLANPTPAC